MIHDVPYQDRSYRTSFSASYKELYKANAQAQNKNSRFVRIFEECGINYLSEILDSAQEAQPFMWVNSEKYIFTASVVQNGKEVYNSFNTLR